MSFRSDLGIALRELPYIRFLTTSNTKYKPLYPDTSMLNVKVLTKLFIGERNPHTKFMGQHPINTSQSENSKHNEDEKWMFINGICTDTSGLINNCMELSHVFKRPIYPIHNVTEGAIRDIFECVIGRTFDKIQAVTNMAYLAVWDALTLHSKVVLIGHSQGGIICSNVVRLIHKNNPELVDKLEVYTFASAHDEFEHKNSEHFANEYDYVARTGVMKYRRRTEGKLYVAPRVKGHLLNAHYLCNFKHQMYCNGNSRLIKYLD